MIFNDSLQRLAKFPKSSKNFPKFPKSSQKFPKVPKSSQKFPKVPKTSQYIIAYCLDFIQFRYILLTFVFTFGSFENFPQNFNLFRNGSKF